MSADQGMPPEGQPPEDTSAPEPKALPPWLQDEDESPAAAAPPSPIRPITPPPKPPEPALPPWLHGAEEEEASPATAPDADDWLSSADSLPDSADSSITFDEWAAQQQEAARPYNIEEEVPDLSADIAEAPAATGPLPEAETLPDWFLGLDEISSDELPEWYTEPLGPEADALPPATETDAWLEPSPAYDSAADEEELPDLELWAGGTDELDDALLSDTGEHQALSWSSTAGFSLDDDADEQTDTVPAGAAPIGGAFDDDDGSFDEPGFEWLSATGEAQPEPDPLEEPDLDQFFTPRSEPEIPDEQSSASAMDDDAAQSWLEELEGLVADVTEPPDSALPDSSASDTPASTMYDDPWLAAVGGAAMAASVADSLNAPYNDEFRVDEAAMTDPLADPNAESGAQFADQPDDLDALFSDAPPADDTGMPEPLADPYTELGGQTPQADAASTDDESDDQPALADVGWLMDMQGSGELIVTGPESQSGPASSAAELAALAALFDSAGEIPAPSDDAPADNDIFAAKPEDEWPAEDDFFAASADNASDAEMQDDASEPGALPPLEGEFDADWLAAGLVAAAASDELPADDDIFAAKPEDEWPAEDDFFAASADNAADAGIEASEPDTLAPLEDEFDADWLAAGLVAASASDELPANDDIIAVKPEDVWSAEDDFFAASADNASDAENEASELDAVAPLEDEVGEDEIDPAWIAAGLVAAAAAGELPDEVDIFAVNPEESWPAEDDASEPDALPPLEGGFDAAWIEAAAFAVAAEHASGVGMQDDAEAEFPTAEEALPSLENEPVDGEFDTDWLSDDIFAEPGSDEMVAALTAEDQPPGYGEMAILDDVPEFDELTVAPMEAVEASDDLDVFGATGPLNLDVLDLFEEDAPAAAAVPAADELPDWMLTGAVPGDEPGAPALEPAAGDDQDWLIGLGLAAGRAASNAQDAQDDQPSADQQFLAPSEDEWIQKLQTGRLDDDEEPESELPATIRPGLTAEQISEVDDVDDYLSLLAAPKVGTGDDSIVPIASAYDLEELLNQNVGTGELTDEFDWYDTPRAEPEPVTDPATYDPYSGAQPFFSDDVPELSAAPETPDWLSDVTVTSVSAGAMVRQQKDRPEEELDERLQKLRRRSPSEPAAEAIDLTAVAPDFSASSPAARGEPGTLSLTPEQDNQAALLVTLVGATTGAAAQSAGAAPAKKRERDARKWGERGERWLIFAVLVAVVLLPFIVSDLRIGNLPPSGFPAGSPGAAAAELVEALPAGALALVGVDYSLGASAELDVMTDALLRHLLLRNAYPVIISGNAATLARMQALFDALNDDGDFLGRLNLSGPLENGRDYFLANFLPGGALGLRAFSQNTAELLLPSLRAALPNVFINGLDDFKLITVLSDRAEDVRAYAEQIAPLAESPIVAGVTYGAAPLVEPYYISGALDGLWVGYQDGLTYSLLTGGLLSAGADDSARPPVLEAAPRDSGPAAPLTQLTATFTPSPTGVPTRTPSATRTPLPSPTPAPLQAIIPGTQGINLREGPSTTAAIVRVLTPGTDLTVIGFNDDRSWAQVSLADGATGWVSADLIRILQGGAAAPSASRFGKRPAPRNQELTPAPPSTRRPTVSPQATASPTTDATATPRATRTPAPTATSTATPTGTPSPTRTPTATYTPTTTLTPTTTATPTPFMVAGGGALNLPAHTPGYRDERWYAMTLGIVASALIIGIGAMFNLIRSLRRRR